VPAPRRDSGSQPRSAPLRDSGSQAPLGPPDSGVDARAIPGPVVSNVQIEPNPNNVLSCVVTFDTDVPARAEVQFGVGEPEFRIRGKERATEHSILVIGMHAETEYLLRVVATDNRGSSSVDSEFTTGTLPDEVPVPELTVNEPASLLGWTLTNVQVDPGPSGGAAKVPAVLLMVDEFGVPVWYHINGDTPDIRGDISAELLDNGNLLIGPAPEEPPSEIDLAGNVIWQGPHQPISGDGPIMTHDAKKLDDGTYVVLRDTAATIVEQYDAENELIWEWALADHFPAPVSGDWCHGNSITVDANAEVMFVNCRWQGTFKVDRTNGEIVWLLSGTFEDATPGDFEFDPPEGRFSDSHDPEFHEDGSVLLYDNRYREGHSRVVEYALDEVNLVATQVWEFPGSFDVDSWYHDDWYSVIWGDADRLANGNVLVTAGVRTLDSTRIFEVTRDGRVVWEMKLRVGLGSYRAERLSPPPLVEPLP
jgi:hypothetical protein